MTSKEVEIASFFSVTHQTDTDDVFVTFKVNDARYKDFVMRWAMRKNGRLIIRGEHLMVIENGKGAIDADV